MEYVLIGAAVLILWIVFAPGKKPNPKTPEQELAEIVEKMIDKKLKK